MAKSPKKASTGKNGDGSEKVSKKSRTRADEGGNNPCFEQRPGALVCDGQNPVVFSAPLTGGPWALVWRNDVIPQGWDWHNLGGARSAPEPAPEATPEPQPPEGGESC